MKRIIFQLVFLSLSYLQCSAQDSLLYLPFDQSTAGLNGESPTVASIDLGYSAGRMGSAIYLDAMDTLRYQALDNIKSDQGTLSFWLKAPAWNTGSEYTILEWGGSGGMIFEKDGANNLRLIINRFAVNGQPEVDVAYNVWSWTPNKWYYVSYTWGNGIVKLYVNGQLVNSDTYGFTFPAISASEFRVGEDDVHGEGPLEAYLDEMIIYDGVRSDSMIFEDYSNYPKPCETLLYLNFDSTAVGENGETPWELPPFFTYNVSYGPGKVNQSAYIDGTSQMYYYTTDNFDEQQGSLSLWLNPNGWSASDEYTILETGGSGGMIFEKDGANNLRMIVNRFAVNGQPEGDVAYNVSSWDMHKWYYVTYTWGNDTLKLYVNGQLVDVQDYPYPFPTNYSGFLTIGDDILQGEGPFRAYMDELKINGCVKTPTEVMQDYLSYMDTVTSYCTELLHLPFDYTADGENGEQPTISTGLSYLNGQIGQAVALGGVNNLKFEKTDNFDEQNGTLSFWINPNGWNAWEEYTILETGGSGGIIFEKDGANNLRMIVNRFAINGQPEGDVAYNVWSWDMHKWYYVTYTWGNDSLKLYVNGQLVDFQDYPYPFPAISGNSLRIGDDNIHGEGPLRAYLDDLRINSCIKSSSEIMQNYLDDLDKASSNCFEQMHLSFDNTDISEDGESPVTSSGLTYVNGKIGQAVSLDASTTLTYTKAGNLDEKQGTLEFWINPNNSWVPAGAYVIMECGGAGGMIFAKDGANNLRLMMNRYSINNQPEVDVAYNVWSWDMSQWYHVAYTWGNHELKLYVNGVQVDSEIYSYDFPSISGSEFRVGAEGLSGPGAPVNAYMDDLRLSGCIKSAYEIQMDYNQGALNTSNLSATSVDALQIQPNPATDAITLNLEKLNGVAGEVEIRNSIGVLVQTFYMDAAPSSKELTIEKIEAGFYTVTVKSALGNYTSKLIKK